MSVLWLRFLSEIDEYMQEKIPSDFFENEETKQALELIQESAYTTSELATYDKYWDSIRTERTFAVDAFDKGIELGMKQGIEQGLAKGIEQGIEKGIEQEKIQIAQNLKNLGLSTTDIQKATGLTSEQIDNL